MDNKSHIIQKVQAEFTVTSNDRYREHSGQLRHAIQDAIQNLEPVLDGLAEESLYRIDSMSVEITLSHAELDQLVKMIEQGVRDEIYEIFNSKPASTESISTEAVEHISENKTHQEILSKFLKTGRLPWWANERSLNDAEPWLMDLPANEWIDFIKSLAAGDSLVINRFVRQISPSVVQEVVRKTAINYPDGEQLLKLQKEILKFLQRQKVSESEIYELNRKLIVRIIRGSAANLDINKMTDHLLSLAFQGLMKTGGKSSDMSSRVNSLKEWIQSSGQPEADYWINRIDHLSDHEYRMRAADEKDPEIATFESDRDEFRAGVSAKNAGVVILHPFLDSLFKNLGYVEKGEFLNDAAKERAVCLVHYLATGEEEFPEYELLIPKFLNGWPMDLSVNRFLNLTDPEREECQSVLSSCIQHWEALKNTSIEGLRNNFLQREGILKKEEFGWSLYIEQQPMDLLLDKLPWNVSIIKMKWMDEMLTVHWH